MYHTSMDAPPPAPKGKGKQEDFKQLSKVSDLEKALIQQTMVNIKVLEMLRGLSGQLRHFHKMVKNNLDNLRVLFLGPPAEDEDITEEKYLLLVKRGNARDLTEEDKPIIEDLIYQMHGKEYEGKKATIESVEGDTKANRIKVYGTFLADQVCLVVRNRWPECGLDTSRQ